MLRMIAHRDALVKRIFRRGVDTAQIIKNRAQKKQLTGFWVVVFVFLSSEPMKLINLQKLVIRI